MGTAHHGYRLDFHLDYDFFHEPAGVHPAIALLYRRSKALAVERRPWGVDLPDGTELPPLVTVRATTRRCGTVSFQLVPVVRPISNSGNSAPYAEAVRLAIRRGYGELDWIILGETAVVLAPERLHVLADSDRDLLAAASERDGAVALLTTPRSKVSQVFVSPNLRPAFGVPETLTVTHDRDLPPLLTDLGGHRPVALRLALDHEPRPLSAPSSDLAGRTSIPPSLTDGTFTSPPPPRPTTTSNSASGPYWCRSSPSSSPTCGLPRREGRGEVSWIEQAGSLVAFMTNVDISSVLLLGLVPFTGLTLFPSCPLLPSTCGRSIDFDRHCCFSQ